MVRSVPDAGEWLRLAVGSRFLGLFGGLFPQKSIPFLIVMVDPLFIETVVPWLMGFGELCLIGFGTLPIRRRVPCPSLAGGIQVGVHVTECLRLN